jgi:DNA-binding response OmpR family regulator
MAKAPLSLPLQGARVMIVEDESILAIDLADRLTREGCNVIGPASREARALELIARDSPDAVVLDLNLDGKLPIDLAKTLIARQIPFVIVTGYGKRQLDVPAFLNAPRLQKPVNMPELVQALSGLIRPAA